MGDDATCYEGGVAIPVAIILEGPPSGTDLVQPALGEFAPVGWTISNVSSFGPVGDEDPPCVATGDSLQCVFAFWPDDGIVVTYDVTPPAGAAGTQCWGDSEPRLSDFNTFPKCYVAFYVLSFFFWLLVHPRSIFINFFPHL